METIESIPVVRDVHTARFACGECAASGSQPSTEVPFICGTIAPANSGVGRSRFPDLRWRGRWSSGNLLQVDDATRKQIMRMHEKDLAARKSLIEAMREGEGGMIGFIERAGPEVFAELERVDAENNSEAMAILDHVGWPTEALVGSEAAEAWVHLVAQRLSGEVLDHALCHLRAAAAAGDVTAVSLAH